MQVLDHGDHVQVPQRRAGVRVAHALLRARVDLRALRGGVRRAREANGRWAMAWTRRRAWGRWRMRAGVPLVAGLDRRGGGPGWRTLLAGGERHRRARATSTRPPCWRDVPETARIMNEEPFGPVAVLNPFRDVRRGDRRGQSPAVRPRGLCVHAQRAAREPAGRAARGRHAGHRTASLIAVPEAPFGGVKESGHGSEEGIEGLDACLVTKFITES